MNMDREQRVRQRAYEIWQAEGCPPGCEQEHWDRAEREVAGEQPTGAKGSDATAPGGEQAKPKRKASGTGKSAAATGETQPKRATKRSAAPSAKTSTGRKGSKTPT